MKSELRNKIMMKLTTSVLLLLFIFLICTVQLHAQHFNGGLFGGMTASQISGDRLAGFDKPGIYSGAFVSYNINPEQSLQLELSFIQKGSRKTANPDIGDYTLYLLNMNYLEIPVWYTYKPIEKAGLGVSLSWAYLFNYKEKDESGEITMPPGAPEFKKYDVSAGAGIFYNINPNLSAHMRISTSVLPVRKHAGGAVYRLNFGQYHNLLAFSVQYQINKPK